MYEAVFKRFFDFIMSIAGIIVLSPIIFLVWIGLVFANHGKPFFFQSRPGKNGKAFDIVKFKTMNDRRDSNGKLLPDAQRLTRIGSFVRKSSLDEIPQLINVLKGDMSIIGPRPLLNEYLPYYSKREETRHSVRPGITGLAQVSGRNILNWDQRLELDAQYVENISLKLDFKIFLLTLKNVIQRKDIVIIPGQMYGKLDVYRSNKSNG